MPLIDPHDPKNHGRPLWMISGPDCAPRFQCVRLRAYTSAHELLPVGERVDGGYTVVWGYSVYQGSPGFRTLGTNLQKWAGTQEGPVFLYDSQEDALAELRRITTPADSAVASVSGGRS